MGRDIKGGFTGDFQKKKQSSGGAGGAGGGKTDATMTLAPKKEEYTDLTTVLYLWEPKNCKYFLQKVLI